MASRYRFVLIVCLLFALLSSSVPVLAQQWDLGGRTIRIQTIWGGQTPLGPSGAYLWYDPDARLQAHIEAVEAMFNCKIEFVHPGWNRAPQVILEGILAGEKPIDFFHTGSALASQALQGMLRPLNDIVGPDFYDNYPETFRYDPYAGHNVGDQIYGFEGTNFVREAVVVFWNKDLLERAGLPDLYTLYEDGEWTWDAFKEVVYQATRDTTGDGEIDQYGLRVVGNFHNESSRMWPHTNNAAFTRNIDGRVVYTVTEPAFIDSLEFMQQLYQDGVVVEGPLAVTNFALAIGMVHGLLNPALLDADDEYGIVPLPKGPNATGHVVPEWSRWQGAIPIYVDDAEAVIAVVQALWQLTDEYIEVGIDAWDERYWHELSLVVPDRKTLEIWKWVTRNSFLSPNSLERMILFDNGWADAMRSIMFDGHSPATALAQLEPAAQALLDEILEQ